MLDPGSLARIEGVHPDLQRVVLRAAELLPAGAFRVTEGLRTAERQRRLVDQGRSRTLKSRHLTGHAVDVVDAAGSYAEPEMRAVSVAMKEAAGQLGIPVEWGGDWKSFEDTPHYQLPWSVYPAGDHGAHVIDGVATEVDAGAPAPAVTPPPAGPPGLPAVWAAMRGSTTLTGALLTLLGTIVQYFDHAVGLVGEAIGEITRLGPVLSFADVRSTGLGLAVFGVVLVVVRRLQAAYAGKQG